MTALDRIDLDGIMARCEAATPAPWFSERCGDFGNPSFIIASVVRDRYGDNALNCGSDEALGEFIAHARTDVPALVAEVERLRGAVDHLASDVALVECQAEVTQLRADLAIARQDAREEYARAEEAEQALSRAKSFRVVFGVIAGLSALTLVVGSIVELVRR